MPLQPAKFSLWAVTVRIVLSALLGAIALSAVPLLPWIVEATGRGWSGEGDGMLVLGLGWNIFYAPWAPIGALVGAGIGWLTIRALRVRGHRKADE